MFRYKTCLAYVISFGSAALAEGRIYIIQGRLQQINPEPGNSLGSGKCKDSLVARSSQFSRLDGSTEINKKLLNYLKIAEIEKNNLFSPCSFPKSELNFSWTLPEQTE